MACGESTVFKIAYNRPSVNSDKIEYAKFDLAFREEGLQSEEYDARAAYFIVSGFIPRLAP